MEKKTIQSPFTLQLTVHSCEALPVADITTSDPYVVTSAGGRLENRTKTVYRNRNPVWNEDFYLKILHRRTVIILNIFDEDKGKEDDQLGTAFIDLTDLPLDLQIRKKYQITACGHFDTNASKIDVTVFIKSNESVIQIVPDELEGAVEIKDSASVSSTTSEDLTSASNEISTTSSIEVELCEIAETLVREHPLFEAQESVVNALTRYITPDRSRFFSKEMLQDLLWDASSLTHSSEEAAALLRNSSRAVYNRTQLRVVNASRLILSTKKCFWHPPIPQNSLQLNLLPNDSKFITIQFANRLSMWVAARWFLLLHDFWKGSIKSFELPGWASSGSFSARCTVHRSDGHRAAGTMVLALERPFELRVNHEITSFKHLHSLVLSADSLKPKEYIMDIEVLSLSAAGEIVPHGEKAHQAEEPTSSKKGLFGALNQVGHGIHGAVKGAVKGAAKGVVHAGSSAISGVSSHPTALIHQAQDDLLAVGKNLRSILHDATAVLGETATHTVVRFDHTIMPALVGEYLYIDLNEDSFVERTLRRTRSEIASADEFLAQDEDLDRKYPEMGRTDAEISILLCQGHKSAHSVFSHKRLTAHMLRQKLDSAVEVLLNVHLVYKIELLHSRGLCLSSPGKMAVGAGSMYVKIKLVDRHGNSKFLGRLQEVKTGSFPPTSNPEWSFNATFKAQDGFDQATYVRVEVCLDDLTSHVTIGSCFIPLSLFRKKSQEYTFPMTPFKQHAVHSCDSNVVNAFGETTFRICRIEEEEEGISPAVMTLRPRLIESNIFNTRWYCECVLAGIVNSDHLRAIEEFSLIPSMEGLELVAVNFALTETFSDHANAPVDDSSSAIAPTTPSTPSTPVSPYPQVTPVTPVSPAAATAPPSAGAAAISGDWAQSEEPDIYAVDVEVFENQRRHRLYPFDWSAKAHTRSAFSDLSYDVGYTFATLDAAAPPEGFTWTSEWCLDKSYIQTDAQGWVYGSTFGAIVTSYKEGKSRIKPTKMKARRRKWVRRAVCTESAGSANRNVTAQFAKTNSVGAEQLMDVSTHSDSEHSPRSPRFPTSPVSPSISSTHPPAPVDVDGTLWRNDLLSHSPNALVTVCQERLSSQAHVLIPWEQVKDAFVVSPSVLSIYVTVHRYMADKHTHISGCFRPAEVEIFVSNCPAVELKSMIDERKWFSSFKSQIRTLVQSGHVSGRDLTEVQLLSASAESEALPQTEELSLGSELVAELSENSIVLEARVKELDKYLGTHNVKEDIRTTKEKSIILRRDCRLRVYMAALIGVGLEGHHHYLEKEVRGIMKRDFEIAQRIQQDTEVATANNRIEFYLDTAEMRIRDAVLCGWNYREQGALQRTLEIFANGYFIEIVGLLGAFFEDNGKTAMKGLGSKVELINTYLKHNDRLAIIIDHALRPYALRAKPAATLSLFLDFDILVSWYTSVLLLEMRDRANHVLNVWKDPTKDVTDNSSQYLYAVPWVPLHIEQKDTQFFTQIPEDLAEVLVTYLQHARIHKDTVALSFQDSVGRLDGEVLVAYTSSFLYLSEQMLAALDSKDWTASVIEEELAEYATWLASVANDAHRVEAHQLYAPNHVTSAVKKEETFEKDNGESAHKEKGIERRTLKSYRRVALIALDHLCCIVFIYAFHERPHLLHDQLYSTWVDTSTDPEGGIEVEPIIPAIMEDVAFFLQEKRSFLQPFCYWKLVSLAAEKMFILYLSLLKSAHHAGAVFGSRETQQIRADLSAMRVGLMTALQASFSENYKYEETAKLIADRFPIIEHCCELFEHDISSLQFDTVMKTMVHAAEKTPVDAVGTAGLLETCLGLKGVSRYTARFVLQASARSTPRASIASGSSLTDLITAASMSRQESVSLPSTPSPTKPIRRRGSLFGSFFGEPSPEPTASVPVKPRRASSLPTKEEGALLAQRAMAMTDAEAVAEAERDDEEKEQEMLRVAKELREQAMLDCFALMIQDLRSHAPFEHQQYTSLTRSSPVERVFGTDYSSEYPLEVQLLHSARPPIGDHSRALSSRIGRLGDSFKRLFQHSPVKNNSQ